MLVVAPTPWNPPPTVHESPASAQAGPLDLTAASLAQQGTELRLQITLRQPFRPAELSPRGPRSLCVTTAARKLSELCVATLHGRPILQYVPVSPPGPVSRLPATVAQVGRTKLVASFAPVDAQLEFGRFAWSVQSRWDGTGDRIPSQGALAGEARLLAEPPCFGAAARDPRHPCRNPALRKVVTPTPDEALLTPNAPCVPYHPERLAYPCYFGVAAARARATVALVGDSHAEHWRAAIEVVAQARRWRAISLSHTSCPFNALRVRKHPPAQVRECGRWNGEVPGFFSRHPEIHTVFVSARAGTTFNGDAVLGYRDAWRALPATVRRIYVLRDTPEARRPEAPCVERLLRRHAAIGARCSGQRAAMLAPDAETTAAKASPRARVLDLTRYMCDRTRCPTVVGGVLVRKDGTHLTRAFATTLGPFVLRAIAGP